MNIWTLRNTSKQAEQLRIKNFELGIGSRSLRGTVCMVNGLLFPYLEMKLKTHKTLNLLNSIRHAFAPLA